MPGNVTKKQTGKRAANPPDSERVVIYVEVPPYIKNQLENLARAHNRKLTGEVIQSFQEYLNRHGLWPAKEG